MTELINRPEYLNQLIQNKDIDLIKLINRPEYLNQLIQNKDIDLIKIVTGLRRCGKSSLLDLFHQYLLDYNVPNNNIIHMNMESLRYRELTDYLSFYDYVSALIPSTGKTYLIFDELQVIEHWEKAIESFRLDYDVDIYITGSNAYLLSSELSTFLSGRYVEIRMLPLSFKEFLSFYRLDYDVDIYITGSNAYLLSSELSTFLSGRYVEIRMLPLSFKEFLSFYKFEEAITMDEKFQKYVHFGGMPVLSEYQFNEVRASQALEGIYSTVIIRDILRRNNQVDQNTLHKIILFLCSNIGSITSPNNIGNVLSTEGDIPSSKGRNIAGRTVDKYIAMLRNAYFFYTVERYDVKAKQLLKTLGKHYIVDTGFRNLLLGYRNDDRGHILENIVFLELLRRDYHVYIGKIGDKEVDFIAENRNLLLGYRNDDRGHILENIVFLELLRRDYHVYIGKIGDKEVDFIAEKPNDKLYIQVTESIQSPQTRERELRPLQVINDNYEKIILSMDRDFITSYDGIKSIQVTESIQSPQTRERELRPLQVINDNYEKIILSMDRDFITSYDGIKSINLIDWLLS